MISILGSRESKRKFKCITAAHSGHGRNHRGIAILRHGLRHRCRSEYDLQDKTMRQFKNGFHDEERHHQQSKSLLCSSLFLHDQKEDTITHHDNEMVIMMITMVNTKDWVNSFFICFLP